jgi:glucokinase
MKKKVSIGVDVGGTNLRSAVVDGSGTILLSARTEVHADLGARFISEKLVSQCFELKQKATDLGLEVCAIGLGVAGKIHKESGRVIFSPNLPALDGHPLGSELAGQTGLPVYMENDANVFCLGEAKAGVAAEIGNWAGITLGTGTGGCLLLNGNLWEGDGLGFSAEIGHMIIEPGGPSCPCGSRGCLEAFASARALIRGAERIIRETNISDGPLYDLFRANSLQADAIFDCARNGDPAAVELFRKMGWALGIAIANLFTVLGIRHAVIGGGVSSSWDLFIEPLKKELARSLSMLEPDRAVVLRTSLGDDAALIGAGIVAEIERSRLDAS